MTPTRGVAARKPLAAALLGLVAAVVLLVAACATGGELADPVVPLSTIVPLSGGGDFPDPARVLLQDADRDLRAGDFDAVAEAAQRAGEGADPATKCVADVVQGVADVNRGNTRAGLQALQDGECAIAAAPPAVGPPLASLRYRGLAAAYAVIGDEDAAERSLENALRVDPDREGVIVAQFCSVKQSRSPERCAPPVTTTRPVTPTTRVPASPSVTSPRSATAPVPTSVVPTTSRPVPTSVRPTTSKPPVATTADDNAPTRSTG